MKTRKENVSHRGSKAKETFHIEEARLRKNKLLSDLFNGDLYLLCVISIFATFELGGYLRSLPKSTQLDHHFQQVLHQYLYH